MSLKGLSIVQTLLKGVGMKFFKNSCNGRGGRRVWEIFTRNGRGKPRMGVGFIMGNF